MLRAGFLATEWQDAAHLCATCPRRAAGCCQRPPNGPFPRPGADPPGIREQTERRTNLCPAGQAAGSRSRRPRGPQSCRPSRHDHAWTQSSAPRDQPDQALLESARSARSSCSSCPSCSRCSRCSRSCGNAVISPSSGVSWRCEGPRQSLRLSAVIRSVTLGGHTQRAARGSAHTDKPLKHPCDWDHATAPLPEERPCSSGEASVMDGWSPGGRVNGMALTA